ncbi:MAG: efflux transporter outer membrane subunit [Proteobacteria bacterium]|nr:efflux transporter outer membrane subunit [Pseudomonadota bacterium]MBU4276474.1 efflux transporter outer membrane subunit [Pseudomonadota bacterium]MBU4381749.1 efflux transporter outer membrane subunit [Pseudomonadota bacterium]MBU4606030.1 efflux transporter outer membrane subunit [Pseudomonadota bacterium]MCG2765703.1 efflux transporter outer membrane subunit [Desulfarculaceae bacterium]
MRPKSALRLSLGLVSAGLLLLSACAPVGPDYSPPQAKPPEVWHSKMQDGLRAGPTQARELSRWWESLNDPTLTQLIAQAVENNLELKQAVARVRQARALRGVREAGLWPSVDAGALAQLHRDTASGDTGTIDQWYSAGFDAGWELDVFGGVRRSIEAAQAQLEASEANLRDVLITLTAEVALNYVELRTYQNRRQTAQANLKSQENTYGFIRSRHEAGLVNRLALEQARYNLENTRSQIPNLTSGVEAAMNRLAVLLGQAPGKLSARLATPAPVPVPPASVAVGVPAEALRRRPDIRRAERQLAAETAKVGVAEADLYPKFRLAGSIGLAAVSSGDFMNLATSGVWSVLPSMSWKVFDAGAVRNRIAAQTAVQEEFLLAYEATVLAALEEVENNLTGYAQEQLRRHSLRQAVDAAQEAEGLSQDLFGAGLINFDSVLDAQRSLLTFQDQLAISEGVVTARLIALYKALGGGWGALPPNPPPAKAPAKQ